MYLTFSCGYDVVCGWDIRNTVVMRGEVERPANAGGALGCGRRTALANWMDM